MEEQVHEGVLTGAIGLVTVLTCEGRWEETRETPVGAPQHRAWHAAGVCGHCLQWFLSGSRVAGQREGNVHRHLLVSAAP